MCVIIGELLLLSQINTEKAPIGGLGWWSLWFIPILKVLGVKHIQRSIKIKYDYAIYIVHK